MKSIKALEREIQLLSQIAEAQTMAAIATAELRAMALKELEIARNQQSHRYAPDRKTEFHAPWSRPIIDHSTFCVEWNGQRCRLGNRLALKLLNRLARWPGQYVSHDELLRDVWDARRSPETIRSAVRDLRRRLRRGKMSALAAAIHSERKSYVLVLPSASDQ